jgi:RNA polymerase sigma factor (sigma-70 family)
MGVGNDFPETLRRVYEADGNALFAYALTLTGCRGLAEDAVHTAFASVLRRGKWPREWRPYVFRCVRNAALAEHRARKRREGRESLFVETQTEAIAPKTLDQASLDAALAQLSADERECIVLKTFHDLSFREIGALRKVSLNTAASWHRRGIEKLQRLYENGNGAGDKEHE